MKSDSRSMKIDIFEYGSLKETANEWLQGSSSLQSFRECWLGFSGLQGFQRIFQISIVCGDFGVPRVTGVQTFGSIEDIETLEDL